MYTRRQKESHRDTVTYEIEMLIFCAQRVKENQHQEESDRYVYLEAFLLHYRNLIEFFSGKHHRRNDDVSIANSTVWAGRELTPADVATINVPAIALDDKYYQDISKYLQHCTCARFDRDKSWDVEMMCEEINPVISAFERAFPA